MEITKGNKTAMVLGATGLVGGFVKNELLDNHIYEKVRVLVRRPITWTHPKLEVCFVDFDRLDDSRHLFEVDDIFCCLGTTMAKAGGKEAFYKVDFTYVYESGRLGAENGANQFLLVSSLGADPESMFFYSRVKGEIEEAIQEFPYWAIRIFQPSILLGERNESRFMEGVASRLGRGLNVLTGGLLGKYKPVEAEVVARAMVQAAQHLDEGVQYYQNKELFALAGTGRELKSS